MDSLNELFDGDPLYVGYFSLMLLTGTVAAIVFARRLPVQLRLGVKGVNPLKIRFSDFLLFTAMFFGWFFVASLIAFNLINKFDPAPSTPSPYWLAAQGFLLHGGMILLFFRWLRSCPSSEELPMNRARLGFFDSMGRALFYLLAFIPVFVLGSLLWESLLELGVEFGMSIELSHQYLVEQIQQIDDPLGLFCIGVVAVLVAPVAEELVFRGCVYRYLSGRIGVMSAIAMTGMFFGFVHGNLAGFLPLTLFGAALCAAYELSGSLKVPIMMHGLFNLNSLVLILLSTPQNAS